MPETVGPSRSIRLWSLQLRGSQALSPVPGWCHTVHLGISAAYPGGLEWVSEAKCPGAANLEPLDAAPNSLHLPLVQSVWLFAPFSQTFDLGSFKFQSFEMLLPWHRFILELLLKTKKKKTGTSSVLVGGWRKAALRGSAKSWVRVSSRSRLRAVKVADTPTPPPKETDRH